MNRTIPTTTLMLALAMGTAAEARTFSHEEMQAAENRCANESLGAAPSSDPHHKRKWDQAELACYRRLGMGDIPEAQRIARNLGDGTTDAYDRKMDSIGRAARSSDEAAVDVSGVLGAAAGLARAASGHGRGHATAQSRAGSATPDYDAGDSFSSSSTRFSNCIPERFYARETKGCSGKYICEVRSGGSGTACLTLTQVRAYCDPRYDAVNGRDCTR